MRLAAAHRPAVTDGEESVRVVSSPRLAINSSCWSRLCKRATQPLCPGQQLTGKRWQSPCGLFLRRAGLKQVTQAVDQLHLSVARPQL